MPASNIAKVFAPTLVGYSSRNPEPVQMLSEAKVQPKVCGRSAANTKTTGFWVEKLTPFKSFMISHSCFPIFCFVTISD